MVIRLGMESAGKCDDPTRVPRPSPTLEIASVTQAADASHNDYTVLGSHVVHVLYINPGQLHISVGAAAWC